MRGGRGDCRRRIELRYHSGLAYRPRSPSVALLAKPVCQRLNSGMEENNLSSYSTLGTHHVDGLEWHKPVR